MLIPKTIIVNPNTGVTSTSGKVEMTEEQKREAFEFLLFMMESNNSQ